MCVCACACVCCVLLSFFWFGFGSCCADVYAICKWLENFFCSSVVFRYWRLEDPHLLYINALHVYAYRCVCTSPKLYNVFVVVGRICFCCCFWLFFFLFVCYSSLQFFFISLFFLFVFATSNVVSHISRKNSITLELFYRIFIEIAILIIYVKQLIWNGYFYWIATLFRPNEWEMCVSTIKETLSSFVYNKNVFPTD